MNRRGILQPPIPQKEFTMKTILIATLLTLCSFSAFAKMTTTNKGYPACTSERSFAMFTNAQVSGDQGTLVALLQRSKCVILKSGMNVNRTSWGFGTSTFVFQGIKFYTNTEALN